MMIYDDISLTYAMSHSARLCLIHDYIYNTLVSARESIAINYCPQVIYLHLNQVLQFFCLN